MGQPQLIKLITFLLCSMLAFAVVAEDAPPMSFAVERFDIQGPNPLDSTATEAALNPYLGEHSGMEGLLAARDALQQALRSAGFTFHRAVLPPQTLAGGVVGIEIVTFDLQDVRIEGNEHYSTESIQRSLPGLLVGTQPDILDLSRSLTVANQHPAKKLKLNFRASETNQDALDAVVKVRDQKPWSVFSALNNIGNETTGYSRITVGGHYANITGHDDVITGSYTTSADNADDVKQFGAFYQLPVYKLRGWLTAFYVTSDVDVGDVQGLFDVSGSGDFLGLSFKHELKSSGRYRHSLTAGLQDRAFDTAISDALLGLAIPGISTKVRSRPLSVRYDGGYNWRSTSVDFYLEFTQNLSFGGHNNKLAYAAVRGPADPGWKLLRFGSLVTHRLPYELLGVAKLTGQYTSEALIPGEQIGFGGDRSVRGFEQRTIAADKGLQLNIEVYSPPIATLYGVQFLAFFDAAHKALNDPLVGQRENDTISSIGVGARWQWRQQLVASVDYGQPLANADGEAADRGNSKIHFALEYRY